MDELDGMSGALRVVVVFKAGERPYELVLAKHGREVDHFEADGERFVRDRPRDWDVMEE